MRKLTLYFGLAILLGALLGIGAAWQNFLQTPLLAPNQSLDYVFEPGSSIKTLANDLHAKGVVQHPNFLILLAYIKGANKKLQAGEYLFLSGITPTQLLNQMVAGKTNFHRFTIIEGWTFKQLLTALNNNPHVVHTINNTMSTAEIMNALGVPPRNPEGLFFPASYPFTIKTTDITLLQKAYQKMSIALNKAWQQRAAGLPYQTPYDALIAASLVEKETAQPTERPIIAGVLLRRLNSNMPLQIDSTLIYGLGDSYTGKLNRLSLQQDTLYNTYLHRGLPPTPIAMPSLQAIQAVLHPDNSMIMYFVAKGDGTHQFSTTLQDQSQAVINYQINMDFPKFAKRMNNRMCIRPWYLSTVLQGLIVC